ncbi:MAG TPA: Mth938-like domain-containing protein [Burkholderiales bacterium]|nr:Mth938-like domain-containing protein [Burkholderiales bacterium]
MKFHLTQAAGRNLITAYGPGYVMVNQDRHEQSLIVMAEELVTDWPPGSVADLQPDHMRTLTEWGLEVVLIGTGPTLRFPGPEIMRPLMEARLGFEVMDVHAACRTYNILVDEGRRVAAALLLA